jgi:hypothetical protein
LNLSKANLLACWEAPRAVLLPENAEGCSSRTGALQRATAMLLRSVRCDNSGAPFTLNSARQRRSLVVAATPADSALTLNVCYEETHILLCRRGALFYLGELTKTQAQLQQALTRIAKLELQVSSPAT